MNAFSRRLPFGVLHRLYKLWRFLSILDAPSVMSPGLSWLRYSEGSRCEVKVKLANGVGSQYSSHYLGTWCIQRY